MSIKIARIKHFQLLDAIQRWWITCYGGRLGHSSSECRPAVKTCQISRSVSQTTTHFYPTANIHTHGSFFITRKGRLFFLPLIPPGLLDTASSSAGVVTLYTSCTSLRALHVLVIVIDTLVCRWVAVLHDRPAAKVISRLAG